MIIFLVQNMAFKLRIELKLMRGRIDTGWAKTRCAPILQKPKPVHS